MSKATDAQKKQILCLIRKRDRREKDGFQDLFKHRKLAKILINLVD